LLTPQFGGSDDVGQLDAVVLAPDIGEPVPDIAAQHERIVGGLVMDALVGDEFEERDGGDLDLLEAISSSFGMVSSVAFLMRWK